MATLQNSAIERPDSLFEIELIIFGTTTRNAARRTVNVLAETSRGAQRICKARYTRAEIAHTHKTGPADRCDSGDLFSGVYLQQQYGRIEF